MSSEPLVCTEDPAQSERRADDFRLLFSKTRVIERPSAQHLRLTLSADEGLDIAVLADEMRCCSWFEFTLTPTAEGAVVLDTVVPSGTGPIRGQAAEESGAGTPEEVLDRFAREAAEAGGVRDVGQTGSPADPGPGQCGCCQG